MYQCMWLKCGLSRKLKQMKEKSSLLRSRFLDVTQSAPNAPPARSLGGALRDIQKTAAKETRKRVERSLVRHQQ